MTIVSTLHDNSFLHLLCPGSNLSLTDRATAIEALRRSQYKFPGRQKIIVSKNWGFTPLRRDEYQEQRALGKVKIDGAYVQFLRNKGPIERNVGLFPTAFETEA